MKSWLAKFSGAVVVSAVASALGLGAGILVLRVLNPSDAGRYTLIVSVATFIGTASVFGQSNLINRLYPRSKFPYHWPRDLFSILLLSTGLTIASMLLVLILYKFTVFEIGFIVGFSFLTVIVTISAAMLNSFRHYAWSSLLLRLTNALLILPVGLIALRVLDANVNNLLISLLVIVAGCGILGLTGVTLFVPKGLHPIPIKERKETLSMAVLVLSNLLLDPGLIVVAGYQLVPAAIAGFSGYFNLFGPFQLLWSILTQTIGVEFGRNPSFPKRKILLTLWGSVMPLIAISWAILPKLVDMLYKGKYDAYAGIAMPIALMGGLLLIEAVPRGFVTAVTDNLTLRGFIASHAILAVIVGGLEIFLVHQFGVYGMAWAGVVLLLGRNLIGYSYFLVTRNQRYQASAVSTNLPNQSE